ncbi:MAG TPA: signal peptidase I [Actinomycetota bacterium]
MSGPDAHAPSSTDERRSRHRDDEPEQHSFLREIPILVLIAFAIAIVIKTFFVQAFYIPSESMEHTLTPGDRVLVSKLSYVLGDIHRDNVVVFSNPNPSAAPDRGAVIEFLHWLGEGLGFAQPENERLIKRVIGLPGDTVAIRDNAVYVNGEPIDEPYLPPGAQACNGSYPETRVPAGHLWVLGDNRCHSGDSRYGLGMVPEDNVVGRAFVIIWPFSDAGGL